MRLTEGKRRIVVGDIHGELEGFIEIIRDAGLIDDRDHWSGRDDILIQTGDVIDRGPHSMEAFDLLKRLQKEAAVVRGEVIRLCGNHELMLLQKDFRYANFNDPEAFVDRVRNEIAGGGLRAAYTDGERLCTHAGLRSAIREILVNEMRSSKPKLEESEIDLFLVSDHINKIFIDSVKNADFEHPIFHVDSIRGGHDPVGGIFWCDFRSISPSIQAWKIPQIFGHTPTSKNGVRTAKGLKLVDVDAGMCHVYGGKRVWLEITPEGHLLQHSKARSKWTTKLLS
jgi:hypothetical protein